MSWCRCLKGGDSPRACRPRAPESSLLIPMSTPGRYADLPETRNSLVGGWALEQLWLFWVAPIVGAVLAGFCYKFLFEEA